MRVVAVIAILAGFIAFGFAHAEISGSDHVTAIYEGGLKLGSEERDYCEFEITLDTVLFKLHTLQGKYRVVRIEVANHSTKPVVLSHRADRLKVRLGKNKEVDAIINMQQADAAVWDRLDSDTRKELAYPKSIPPAEGSSRMSLFVFLPVTVVDTPWSFEFFIDSLNGSLRLEPPPATAL